MGAFCEFEGPHSKVVQYLCVVLIFAQNIYAVLLYLRICVGRTPRQSR